MIDSERLRGKLDELFTYLSELEEDLPEEPDGYVEDRRTRMAVERDF